MRVITALVAALSFAGCTTPSQDREWVGHDFNLSGKHVFISAPRGDVADKTAVGITSARDVPLLQRAWVFSSAGAVEAKLDFHRFDVTASDDFFANVSRRMLGDVRSVFPAAEIVNVRTRNIGRRAWTCYVVTRINISECVLRVDDQSYLSWRADWIANLQPAAPEEARRIIEKVEGSIEVAF